MPLSSQPRVGENLLLLGQKHRAWVACGVLLGIAVGGLAGSQMPLVYQSSAQISIVKKRPDAVTGVDTRSFDENMTPAQEMLKSSRIIERAIQKMTAITDDQPALMEQIRNSLTVLPAKGPAGQAFVFRLSYRGPDADGCQTVLTAVLDSYKEFMDKKHQAVSEDTIELVLRDKQSLEKDITEKELAYRAFREKAPLLGKGRDGLELRQERLNSIQTKRSALLMQRIELESQLKALQQAQKSGASDDAILAMVLDFARKNDGSDSSRDKQVSMAEQLFPLLLEERKLSQLHGAKHPDVLEIRARIDSARRLLLLPPTAWNGAAENRPNAAGDPIKLHMQLLSQKLDHLKISESLLGDVFQREQDEARQMSVYEIQNDSMRTRLAMSQQLYEALVKRLNEVSLVRNVGGYQIELIEPPTVGKRVAPSLMLFLSAGAIGGLCVGLILAYWAESRAAINPSHRDEVGEIKNNAGLELAGSVTQR